MLLHGADYLESWFGTGPSLPMNFVRTGYQGVSIFFTLSGFVLAYNYSQLSTTREDVGNFWRARFARIYPVYLLGAILYLPIGYYKERIAANESGLGVFSGISESATAFGVALSLQQSWLPEFVLRWNPPAWSVSDEVFFYFTFPLWLEIMRRWPLRKGWFLAASVFGLWIVAMIPPALSWQGGIEGLADVPAIARAQDTPLTSLAAVVRFNPVARLPEFLIGVACGLHFVSRQEDNGCVTSDQQKFRPYLTTFVVSGIILFSMFATPYLPLPFVHNGFVAPLSALLILGLADSGSQVFAPSWLVRLGDASYAMYLMHWPIRSALRFVEQKFLVGQDEGALAGGLLLLYLTLSIAFGLAVFLWLEEPARRWLRGK